MERQARDAFKALLTKHRCAGVVYTAGQMGPLCMFSGLIILQVRSTRLCVQVDWICRAPYHPLASCRPSCP